MRKAEKILIKNGIRPTKMRIAVCQFFRRKLYAASLREVEKALIKKNSSIGDRATIYRSIKLFQEKGLVHQIDDGTAVAKYAYSKSDNLDFHLHFHCYQCRKTFCLPEKVRQESLPSKPEIVNANLVIQGICEKCKKKIHENLC